MVQNLKGKILIYKSDLSLGICKVSTFERKPFLGARRRKIKETTAPWPARVAWLMKVAQSPSWMPFFRRAKEEITKTHTKWANVFQYQCVWQLHLPTWKTLWCNSHARRSLKKSPAPALPAGINSHHRAQIIHFRQSLCRRLDFNHTSKASTKKGVKCESAIWISFQNQHSLSRNWVCDIQQVHTRAKLKSHFSCHSSAVCSLTCRVKSVGVQGGWKNWIII
jgi:hypothetical protein